MADNPWADYATRVIPPHWGTKFTKTIHQKPSTSIDPAKVTLPRGYTVVITGAGKGIGEYIAKAYVEAKAQNIIITSRTKSDLERVKAELEEMASKQNHSINVTVCPGDASKPDSFKSVAEALKNSCEGRLDCLINNAGGGSMLGADRPLHEGNLDVFTNVTTLNYNGYYYSMMTLIPFLLNGPSSGKTLINIVSAAAHLIDTIPPSYNVSKLATTRMTEVVAAAYAKEGLRSFALHPGSVPTPGALAELPGSEKFLIDDIHLCGAVCVWLSKEQPAWASGRYISATWDMDEFKAMEQEIVTGDKLKFKMVV